MNWLELAKLPIFVLGSIAVASALFLFSPVPRWLGVSPYFRSENRPWIAITFTLSTLFTLGSGGAWAWKQREAAERLKRSAAQRAQARTESIRTERERQEATLRHLAGDEIVHVRMFLKKDAGTIGFFDNGTMLGLTAKDVVLCVDAGPHGRQHATHYTLAPWVREALDRDPTFLDRPEPKN
jgi:hypothetical protein